MWYMPRNITTLGVSTLTNRVPIGIATGVGGSSRQFFPLSFETARNGTIGGLKGVSMLVVIHMT